MFRRQKLLGSSNRGDKNKGKREKKRRVLPEEEEKEMKPWADLPSELLEKIMTPLELKDNIRSSVVCKRWLETAESVRVSDQPLWLMRFSEGSSWYDLYNPWLRKSHVVRIPELIGSTICYSRDGWLLMQSKFFDLFFFNPFTRTRMDLRVVSPGYSHALGFSCAPTSNDCLVVSFLHICSYVVTIKTCRPDSTEWTVKRFTGRIPFIGTEWNKLVFSNDVFYCLSLTGWLGVFDPVENEWNVLPVQPPENPEHISPGEWWKGKYLVESKGEIFIIYTSTNVKPIMYKLNLLAWEWEQQASLKGLGVFASFRCCETRQNLLGRLRDSVFFPKVVYYGKCIVSYKADEGRYYPGRDSFVWEGHSQAERVWVKAPDNVSDLF